MIERGHTDNVVVVLAPQGGENCFDRISAH